MSSAEMTRGRLAEYERPWSGTTTHTPKAVGTTPRAYLPHPPLVSGGWYHRLSDQEVVGPGRYPVPSADDRSTAAALLWTFFLGPLGLCYVSATGAIVATAATAGLLVVTGSALVLAAVWPLAMVLAVVRAR